MGKVDHLLKGNARMKDADWSLFIVVFYSMHRWVWAYRTSASGAFAETTESIPQ